MAAEDLKQFKEAMEEWERKLGLSQTEMDVAQVEVILNMSRDRLAELSSREAAEASFVLAQFAFLIQRRENQCKAFSEWATNIDAPGMGHLRRSARAKAGRIAFLGKRVEFMAQCLQAVQRSRFREEEKS